MVHPVVFLSSTRGLQVQDLSSLIGKYVYNSYWRAWDHVLSVDNGQVTVQEVNLDGSVSGNVRTHRTAIPVGSAFNMPFDPYKI